MLSKEQIKEVWLETPMGDHPDVGKVYDQAALAITLQAEIERLTIYNKNFETSQKSLREEYCDLAAEIDRLKAELVTEKEASIRIRNMTDDYATIDGDVQKLVIVTLWKLFHESGAENYLVMNVQHNDEMYELTMQKKDKLSPADLNTALKAKLSAIERYFVQPCPELMELIDKIDPAKLATPNSEDCCWYRAKRDVLAIVKEGEGK